MVKAKGKRRGAEAVGRLVEQGLANLQIAAKIREHTAPLVWAEVVGPQVAGATEVIGVRDGVLLVSTKSAVWSNELTFYKPDILRRLNVRIGATGANAREGAIKDILFQNRGLRQKRDQENNEPAVPLGPAPEELDDVELSPGELATIEAGIALVTDDVLRARLRRVRIADVRLRTWRLDNGWTPCTRCGDLAPPSPTPSAAVACRRCRIKSLTRG